LSRHVSVVPSGTTHPEGANSVNRGLWDQAGATQVKRAEAWSLLSHRSHRSLDHSRLSGRSRRTGSCSHGRNVGGASASRGPARPPTASGSGGMTWPRSGGGDFRVDAEGGGDARRAVRRPKIVGRAPMRAPLGRLLLGRQPRSTDCGRLARWAGRRSRRRRPLPCPCPWHCLVAVVTGHTASLGIPGDWAISCSAASMMASTAAAAAAGSRASTACTMAR
jgi:hypothetical protein